MELRGERKNSKSEVLEETIKKEILQFKCFVLAEPKQNYPDCRFEGGCCYLAFGFGISVLKAIQIANVLWSCDSENEISQVGFSSLSKCTQNPGKAPQEAYIGRMLVY